MAKSARIVPSVVEASGMTLASIPRHRGKTVAKPLALSHLGLALSEKQIPQIVENLESG
jgi:hypothetical protein